MNPSNAAPCLQTPMPCLRHISAYLDTPSTWNLRRVSSTTLKCVTFAFQIGEAWHGDNKNKCKSVFEPCKNARTNCRDQNLILVKKSGNGTFGTENERDRNMYT